MLNNPCGRVISRLMLLLLACLPVATAHAAAQATQWTRVSIHGHKIYYAVRGSGPNVVFLHGGGDSGEHSFARQLDVFSEHHHIVAPDQVLAQAQTLARQVAEGPTFANTMTKRMLAMEWAMSVEEAIEAEAVAQALCMTTADFARAFEAFSNKAKPVFQGN